MQEAKSKDFLTAEYSKLISGLRRVPEVLL